MALALILIDALSPIYVARSTLPAIYDLAHTGFMGSLANIYAYRGIEATLFTGHWPDEHGVWGEFSPAPQSRERCADQLVQLAIWAGDLIPSDRLRLDVRYVVSRLRQPNRMLPTGNLIPAKLVPAFTSSIEQPIWAEGSLGAIPTLFNELRAIGKSFVPVVYPMVKRDDQVVECARRLLTRSNLPDFWYIKFSALDALGHRFGPNVTQLASALKLLNNQLETLVAMLRSAYANRDIDIVILSDHGMSQVTGCIDIGSLLKRVRAVPGRDFLYFLDSTTVRFWSEDHRLCDELTELFAGRPKMRVLDQATRQFLHIPDGAQSGNVMIALDEGQVVFPDFFRRQAAPAGMHGYAFVRTDAGLPFLAAEASIATCLPEQDPLTHVDVWVAMRKRLGLMNVNSSTDVEA